MVDKLNCDHLCSTARINEKIFNERNLIKNKSEPCIHNDWESNYEIEVENALFKEWVEDDDTTAIKKHVSLVKFITNSIQDEMLNRITRYREKRMHEAKKRYDIWLQKKTQQEIEKKRLEVEELREQKEKMELDKKLRLEESKLQFKMWLRKKEEQELAQQWMQLLYLLENDDI
ncbi:hypothetical protein FQA39_LY03771 [Lamprigera yunnana]|nr:hypothetical protein FQA39_LY03771 [Lamprigera yunnana]